MSVTFPVKPVEPTLDRAPFDRGDGDFAIHVEGVNHFYGQGELKKQVLFDNQLRVRPGEIVIMTGPSGSGKTTLLTLIGTLRSVQVGSLQVLGRELLGATPKQLVELRRELGFIFQAHNLFESLSAFQNVRMALELFDMSADEMAPRCEAMLTRLGLGHRIHYKPDSLSGGQKQRVAIARGLVHKPRLVLADEPTAALDEKSGRDVVSLFQELAKEQDCSIVMVTHDNRILDVADRIVNMVDGRIRSNVLVQEAARICEFLTKCPVFSHLTPGTLASVADKMKPEKYEPGQVIIRQGDAGDKFYLVREGAVAVSVTEAGKTRSLAKLVEGQFFGERALLTGEPRNATIAADQPTVVYALGKDDFQAVLAASHTFEEELRKALFERQ